MEFLDDIADPNSDEVSAKFSNRIVEQIQYEKHLTLSSEKLVYNDQLTYEFEKKLGKLYVTTVTYI